MLGTFVMLLCVGSAVSDTACVGQGGQCVDWRETACTAGVATGLCSGDSNRRCCLACSPSCLANEQLWSASDGQCTSAGGKCQLDSNYCAGSYSSGMCGGPAARQCCGKAGSGGRGSGCYGNVMNIDTTGASSATASQDNLSVTGVAASQKLVSADLGRLERYQSRIAEAASALCVDPAVVAAIISRESRAGAVLDNGWGDGGNGFGLMQVDKRYHTPVGAWDSVEHIRQGTGILIDMINAIKTKFPSWSQDQQMKGGISAYNAGPGNVQSYPNMDVGTTGNDYASDVVARAQWLRANGHCC